MKSTYLTFAFVLFALLIAAVILIFLAMSLFKNNTPDNKENNTAIPTNPIAPSQRLNDLYAIKSTPENNAIDVPLNQKIIVSFNRSFSLSEINIAILPNFEHELNVLGNSLIISPVKSLEKSTIYVLTIRTGVSFKLFSIKFTTLGPTPTLISAPGDWKKDVENIEKKSQPDVFLANKVPYSNNDFSIVYGYKTTPTEHFFFSVQLKGPSKDASKNNFINWLKSLGLTETQIQSLDIVYD